MAAITIYGERNPQAPRELGTFSFLIGKWTGTGRTRLPDGNYSGKTWSPPLIEMTMTRAE